MEMLLKIWMMMTTMMMKQGKVEIKCNVYFFDNSRWLGGSSQAAAVALHAGLSYPGRLGAILATQGHMLTSTPIPADLAERGTPIRVFNGLADETMPWDSWVSGTFERLQRSGADVKIHTDVDVEHCDDEAEGRWCRTFLAEMWGRFDFASE